MVKEGWWGTSLRDYPMYTIVVNMAGQRSSDNVEATCVLPTGAYSTEYYCSYCTYG